MGGIQGFFIALGLGVLISCSPAGSQKPAQQVQDSGVREVLIFQEPNPPPSWFLEKTTPEDDPANLYFLGFSQKLSKENDARQSAQADATNQFLAYTGVTARNFVAYVNEFSSAGGMISGETQGVETTDQMAEAFVSRIQTVGRYVEKYSMQQGGVPLGNRYKAAVLVKVPKDEYESVQRWKAQQVHQRKAALSEIIQAARQLAGEGQVLGALQALHQARSLANANNPTEAAVLRAQIQQEEQSIAGRVQVELLTKAGFQTDLLTPPQSIEARIRFAEEGKELLLAGFPLELKTDKQHLLQSSSDPRGLVQFFLPRMEETGAVRLRIAPSAALTENISPEAFQTLRAKTNQLHFEVIEQ